jgi:hypothetical protein
MTGVPESDNLVSPFGHGPINPKDAPERRDPGSFEIGGPGFAFDK